MDIIYFDHAATTPILPEVQKEIQPFINTYYGNASSIYSLARMSHKAIQKARTQLAIALNARPEEIFFTSGGSESDNWAIKGVASALQSKGHHIITSCIEHPAILNTCHYLEHHGYEVTYLPVDSNGIINVKDLEKSIRSDTILVSIMTANNEIGTLMPINEIGSICHDNKIYFHTDAVQAMGHIPINVQESCIDFLSLSGHKFGAPKGIGALYIRNGCYIDPLIHGGSQERHQRAGTENLIGIVGIGKAIETSINQLNNIHTLSALRDKIIISLLSDIPNTFINGSTKNRLPGHISITFKGVKSEDLLAMLDMYGICVSAGSACASKDNKLSYVLKSIGLSDSEIQNTIRITLGNENTISEVEKFISIMPNIISQLRN